MNEVPVNRENAQIARAAGVVSAITMFSRILGFLRDMVVACFFGAGWKTDAFFVAFRIPNLLRRLLAEGSLTVSFVPVFTEYLRNRSTRAALELAEVAFTLLSIILLIVTFLGVVFAPQIVILMAPGFMNVSSQFELAVSLTRFMFPYIFFISLVALCMGVLNSFRHFAAPAFSPVILNVSMILCALFLRDFFAEPIFALAIGVIIGGFLQLAIQIPFLLLKGVNVRPNFTFNHPGIKKIGKMMLPAVFGAAIYQINVFVGTILASLLPKGSVSYLYYADRVVELPLGVFAIAVGTAVLPSFSTQVARGSIEEMKMTISFSLRLIMYIAIPATVAMILLREPIISALFERGAFDRISTTRTAEALLFYSLGLWAFSSIRVITSAFYSLQDAKTPMNAAIIALVINILFSVVLMYPMKHGGLALATSIASAVNVVILGVKLRVKIGSYLDNAFWFSILKIVLSSSVMGVSLVLFDYLIPWKGCLSVYQKIFYLFGCTFLGLFVFIGSSLILKCQEISMMIDSLKTRTKTI
ncbi:MAG: murein biosynthesis integral membrane protein MurJ [Syntrophales bacterium]|nr:murein biosynthesis integral membrane protein MurJ [Syntrophales bacterium]